MRGADAVVHLAWSIQDRVPEVRERTNVVGSRRVFDAAIAAGVPRIVHLSSIGAYSPGGREHPADESWPTGGVAASTYSRHKARVEQMLDEIEREHPDLEVVRVRPALVLKGDAAVEIHDLFMGAAVPRPLVPSGSLVARVAARLPLAIQVVHSLDVGDALVRILDRQPRGAFNLAADPVLGRTPRPGAVLGALRSVATGAHGIGLLPSEPGWMELARQVPLLDTTRARTELGLSPHHDALATLAELLDGMRRGQTFPTPPLQLGGDDEARRFDERTARGRWTAMAV